jgi:hypothetical protein
MAQTLELWFQGVYPLLQLDYRVPLTESKCRYGYVDRSTDWFDACSGCRWVLVVE